MAPAPPITNELQDNTLSLYIDDYDLLPSYAQQNKASLDPIYAVGLILTVLLSLGALTILFTLGSKWWSKKRVGRDEEQQDCIEDKTKDINSRPEEQQMKEEHGRMVGYVNPSAARALSEYRIGLDPIPEEEEEEERVAIQKAYTTGLALQRPSESLSSLSSLSSMASFRSEEDLAEVEIHGHSIARRIRTWADPEEVPRYVDFETDLTRDSLKLCWESSDKEILGTFEVRRAVSQNMEVSKAKLVTVVCFATTLPVYDVDIDEPEDTDESSDGSGDDGYEVDSFCSTMTGSSAGLDMRTL